MKTNEELLTAASDNIEGVCVVLDAMVTLKEVDYAIGKMPDGTYNIRRHQQGDPEFCISVGGYQGAQLNKNHLKAMLALIEDKEREEDEGGH